MTEIVIVNWFSVDLDFTCNLVSVKWIAKFRLACLDMFQSLSNLPLLEGLSEMINMIYTLYTLYLFAQHKQYCILMCIGIFM